MLLLSVPVFVLDLLVFIVHLAERCGQHVMNWRLVYRCLRLATD